MFDSDTINDLRDRLDAEERAHADTSHTLACRVAELIEARREIAHLNAKLTRCAQAHSQPKRIDY